MLSVTLTVVLGVRKACNQAWSETFRTWSNLWWAHKVDQLNENWLQTKCFYVIILQPVSVSIVVMQSLCARTGYVVWWVDKLHSIFTCYFFCAWEMTYNTVCVNILLYCIQYTSCHIARPRNDLLCVEWDIKLTHAILIAVTLLKE